jgi:F420-non-reducing hydrogenase iron-sulfur subunit
MHAGRWLAQERPEPKVLVFICNWCLRANAEWMGLHQLPPHIRVVNIPCSGRVDPTFILAGLEEGAEAVLVIGCQPGECHYLRGTYISQGKVTLLQRVLAQMGLADGRVRFDRIGSADRGKFLHLIEEVTAQAQDRRAAQPVLAGREGEA